MTIIKLQGENSHLHVVEVTHDKPAFVLATSYVLLPGGTTPALLIQLLNNSDPSLFQLSVSLIIPLPQLPDSDRTDFPLLASCLTGSDG